MSDEINAHDLVAFAIVELNVNVPLDTFYNLNPNDKLYRSLVNAWENKQRREDGRIGLLCAVIANSAGSTKNYQPADFMPKKAKTKQDSEVEIKANFEKYNASVVD